MNNQGEKGKKSKKDSALPPASEPLAEGEPAKRKRGRPKTSPHDPATQHRLRVQRYRQAKQEADEVKVEIYLPRAWHDWLLNVRKVSSLSDAALSAFAPWLEKQGYPVEPGHQPPPADKA